MQGVEQYIWDATICVQNNGGGYNRFAYIT